MPLQIKVFGKLAELTGGNTIVVSDVADTNALQNALYRSYPALKELRFFIAVNNRMIKENTVIESSAVLALLPPFSGG